LTRRQRLAGPRRLLLAAALAAAVLSALIGVPAAAQLDATSTTTTTAGPVLPSPSAYWLVASDGGIFAFGGAGFYGSTGSLHLNKPIVGLAGTPGSQGYWLDAADGGIFAFGNAPFLGSVPGVLKTGQSLDAPIVGMAATSSGLGYWMVASDGGIFAFGNAGYYGSVPGVLKAGQALNAPIVGMAATPDGKGYWLVASDGGIFAFGDATFYGSTGSTTLDKPIVGMAATADGLGYWFVASDGGIFAFGDAKFDGSLGGVPLKYPIASMAATSDGGGYWLVDTNGAVSPFGDAEYWGSTPQVLNKPVVGMAEAAGTGAVTGGSYPSGSYGYDISNYQCNKALPDNGAIRIVEIEGGSFGMTNPCLATEANWAGGGLNLYVYLTYANTLPSGVNIAPPAACNGDTSCAYGYADTEDAFNKATNAGVATGVTWWLDVESDPSWSSNTHENDEMIEGALLGLKSEGINNVGIYTSPLTWNGIAGDFQPAVPIWLAWYTDDPQSNCTTGISYAAAHGNNLPSGPIVITQYTDDVTYAGNGFDGDYAC
jgi:hypothetical protein